MKAQTTIKRRLIVLLAALVAAGSVGLVSAPRASAGDTWLIMTLEVSGKGTITPAMPGYGGCSSKCTYYAYDPAGDGWGLVGFYAKPAPGWAFVGWEGGCPAPWVQPCMFVGGSNTYVKAKFATRVWR